MKDQFETETSEISLRLANYDDIFSDFDIRPYSRRAISVDFLDEIKRATAEKDIAEVELILNAPEKLRDEHHELVIKERLAAHFKRHYRKLLAEKQHVTRLGISMVSTGVVFMMAATYLSFKGHPSDMLSAFLLVFLEPAAWFLLWEGMDQIIFNSKKINPDLDFYRKMSDSHERTYFKSY